MTTVVEAGAGTVQRSADALGQMLFVGGRVERFEQDGRLQLIALLRRGLMPSSVVIDVGCGALRAGYWLIHFLDADRYHGIDPSQARLEAARAAILEPGLEALKRPRFDLNPDFDLSVFGVSPSFVLARSVWSHASKSQIEVLLDSFAAVATPDGLLLASFNPVAPWYRRTRPWKAASSLVRRVRGGREQTGSRSSAAVGRRSARHAKRRGEGDGDAMAWRFEDYQGESWGGGSDKAGGIVAHRLAWIEGACQRRDLVATATSVDSFGRQTWLEIRRRRAPA